MRLRHFDKSSLADGFFSKTARTRSNAGSLPMIILRISTATARQQIRSLSSLAQRYDNHGDRNL